MVRETKVKNKLITFILIILGILLIVPIITSVANEFEIVNTEEEYTYIDFDATWNNDYTTIETEKHGVTGNPYSIFFTTGFNTTGQFQNFKLTVEDVTNDLAVADVSLGISIDGGSPFKNISSNGKKLYFEDVVTPGKEGRGRVYINCNIEKYGIESYKRTIKLNLTGTHVINGISYDVNLVRFLTIDLITHRTLTDLSIRSQMKEKEYIFDNDSLVGEKVLYEVRVNHNIDIKEFELQFVPNKDGIKSGTVTNIYAKNNTNSYTYKEEDGAWYISRKQATMFGDSNLKIFYVEVYYERPEREITTTLGNVINVTIVSENVIINSEEQRIEEARLSKNQTYSFDDAYADGDAGISIYTTSFSKINTPISEYTINEIVNNKDINLSFSTDIDWNHQSKYNSRVIVRNYNYDNYNSKISYINEEGNDSEIILNKDNMEVNAIYISNWLDGIDNIKFYEEGKTETDEPFFVATRDNRSFRVTEEKIGGYYAIVNGVPSGTVTLTWTTNWKLKSSELGLSETEKANIYRIQRSQRGIYEVTRGDSSFSNDLTIYGSSYYYISNNTETVKSDTSYLSVNGRNVNTSFSDIGKEIENSITLTMKNSTDFYDSYIIKNENPIIYVKLIKDFIYDYNSIKVEETSSNENIKLKDQEIEVVEIGNEEYLKIPFIGTYTALKNSDNDYGINIEFKRTLKSNVTQYNKENIEIYMQTDSGVYYNGTIDEKDINQNENS